jgi:hypothetical protein
MERWEKLPEALRWILYLPIVIVLPVIIGFLLQVLLTQWMPGWGWFAPIANFFVAVFGAYLMVQVFFPIVFAFAPRGKKVTGWCFYVLLMLGSAIAFLLLVARRLGTWGLLGDALRPPEGVVGWEAKDWGELGQTVVWLILGTIVFRQCLSQENERLARTRSHALQPLTGNPARR